MVYGEKTKIMSVDIFLMKTITGIDHHYKITDNDGNVLLSTKSINTLNARINDTIKTEKQSLV